MDTSYMPPWLVLAILALVNSTFAQFGGGGGGYGGYDGDGDGDGDGNGNGNGNGDGDGFDPSGSSSEASGIYTAQGQRVIHGILACVAFVILFPLGAISMTTLSGRYAFRIHVMMQSIASILFLAAAIFGFIILKSVYVSGTNDAPLLLTNSYARSHPIIGIVIFLLVIVQPFLGYFHHRQFKLTQRRVLVSHLHLWNGRIAIILGIVNGGLGLKIAHASDAVKLKYTIVAAVLGGLWLAASLLGEARRARRRGVFGRLRTSRRTTKGRRAARSERPRRKTTEEHESETGSVGWRYS